MSNPSLAIVLVCVILIFSSAVRADDPQTPAPTIDPLPAGWKHGEDTPAIHRGEKTELKAFFDVLAEPKDDSFADWCKSTVKRAKQKSPLSDEQDTPLKAEKIGGYDVMMYESTGTLFGSPAHCRLYCIELPNKFARLTCSVDGANWDKVVDQLDELVKNMK